ncbi:MAG: hypothetical protein ABEJ35_04250 [Halobacteriaceae archaeon]
MPRLPMFRSSRLASTELGGLALLAGCLLALLLSLGFLGPAGGAPTDGVATLTYFIVLPVAGLLGGAYAYFEGPYSGLPLFVLGSYMGVFGLGLSLTTGLSRRPSGILLGAGLLILAFAVTAVVASVFSVVSAAPSPSVRVPSR